MQLAQFELLNNKIGTLTNSINELVIALSSHIMRQPIDDAELLEQ